VRLNGASNAFTVTYTDTEKRTKSFSIRKYGHEGAKRKAIAFRKEKEQSIANYIEAFGK